MPNRTPERQQAPAFAAGVGLGGHWPAAVKAALEALGPLPAGANLGFVYVSQAFAEDLSSIATFLAETTRLRDWVGAVGHGLLGVKDGEAAVTLLAGAFPDGGFHLFTGYSPDDGPAFLSDHGAWLRSQHAVTGLVHADPREPLVVEMVSGLAETADAYLVGALTHSGEAPSQVAGRMVSSGLSGVLFGDAVPLAVGLTQGCHPIGPPHLVTEVVDNVVMGLDGRPALEVLKEEAGEMIARDLSRAAGYIHVALPTEGSDNLNDYATRNLMGIDPKRGWLAVGERLLSGESLMFVRRDANAAQADMTRMLTGLKTRLAGRVPRGGLYISCIARGASMFGAADRETEMIAEMLGDFPLIGLSAAGEICHDRLYGYTGVLALFL